LGGNSLLEIVVFGKEAGKSAAKRAQELPMLNTSIEEQSHIIEELDSWSNEISFYEVQKNLAELFYTKVGIVRRKSELLEVQQELEKIQSQLPQMGVTDTNRVYNTNLIEFLEFCNMLQVAQSVVTSALQREQSCGAHFVVGE
jgi:succinate dehydrogenase / fumarate reductase flavoprotein subunit